MPIYCDLLLIQLSHFSFTEISKVRASLFQINGVRKEPLSLPEADGPAVTLNEKVYVPVKEHPDVSDIYNIATDKFCVPCRPSRQRYIHICFFRELENIQTNHHHHIIIITCSCNEISQCHPGSVPYLSISSASKAMCFFSAQMI